jgi:hypothetical protein
MTILEFLRDLDAARRELERDAGISIRLEAVDEHSIREGEWWPTSNEEDGNWRCGYFVEERYRVYPKRPATSVYLEFDTRDLWPVGCYARESRNLTEYTAYPRPIAAALFDCFDVIYAALLYPRADAHERLARGLRTIADDIARAREKEQKGGGA